MANIDNNQEPVVSSDYMEQEVHAEEQKKKKRPTRLVLATSLVVVGMVIWALFFRDSGAVVDTNITAPPTINTTAGGEVQENSEQYAESLRRANEARSQQALENNETFISTPEGVLRDLEVTTETLPEEVVEEPEPQPETTAVVTRRRAVTPQLRRVDEQPAPAPGQATAVNNQQQAEENPFIGLIGTQMSQVASGFVPQTPATETYEIPEEPQPATSEQTPASTAQSQPQAQMANNPVVVDDNGQIVRSDPLDGLALDAAGNPVAVDPFSEPSQDSLAAAAAQRQASGDETQNVTDEEVREQEKVYVRAGDVLYGEVLATVNSDMPMPVIAEVTTGEHKGARLKGTFTTDPVSGKMIVSFSQMSKGDVTVPVTAVAIDGYNADSAVRSGIERRYLKRYGTVFASTFITGLAEGLAEPEQVVVTDEDGNEEVVSQKRTTSESAWNGVASAAQTISADITATAPKGPKVYLHSGYPLGILFMDDLRDNPDETEDLDE